MAVATVATAIGTLLLALYTYLLAASTRESVRSADRLTSLAVTQLEEVRAQRDLLAVQAQRAGEQAEATTRLADASAQNAAEAAKARIDATAPLVHMTVALERVEVFDRATGKNELLHESDRWWEPQLKNLSFLVVLRFSFRNVGASPAQLFFGGNSSQFERVMKSRGYHTLLGVGEEPYSDTFTAKLAGDEAARGRLLDMSVTYNGLISGEMFDHVQWNGWVTPLKLTDGEAVPNVGWTVNAGGAQVVRSYPNIEQPEEMARARARLLNPHNTDA